MADRRFTFAEYWDRSYPNLHWRWWKPWQSRTYKLRRVYPPRDSNRDLRIARLDGDA